jgi:hypothetical protein
MLLSTHADHDRRHRVREFVCSYRTLRDDEGQAVHPPAVPLSDPKVAARTLAPLLAGEPVEVFAVACLSTKHLLLAWYVVTRHASEHAGLAAGRVRAGVSDTRHHRTARRAQPPERGSNTEPRRRTLDDPARASGRRARHAAPRSPDRQRRRPVLQLPRGRHRGPTTAARRPHMTRRWAITRCDGRASLGPVQASPLRSDPVGARTPRGLDRSSGPPRLGSYLMAHL